MPHAITLTAGSAERRDWIETIGLLAMIGFAGALQLSIAAADILLALTLVAWVVWLAWHHTKPAVPPFFWPLAGYAAVTLIASVFSVDPGVSLVDSKQLVLFLIVPAVYHLARGSRAPLVIQVIVTVGAATAAFGVIQYAMLEYNHLGQRPQGSMGHYMTYSGLLMLVVCASVARVLFDREDRIWPALVMPALLVALALTLSRSAWVGACAAIALLLALKDFKLLVILPAVAVVFFALAPNGVMDRFNSVFDPQDPTRRDRVAMMHAGFSMIRADPWTGVGPNMVEPLYPQYRGPDAVEKQNPHLHNVPLQIAAERGIPALLVWLGFVGYAAAGLVRMIRARRQLCLASIGLAAIVAMITAGMFEHNFGDSEFLMLFLVLITLPFAADRPALSEVEGPEAPPTRA
ncbi:MAG: O-antigen ligase family protein [Acidobacteria bacterium]|nr:O-antigen ligase family protein [Acidobacteriota bacterium]